MIPNMDGLAYAGTSAPGEKESVVNSFAVKVKAAEVQKLEKGKETPVISEKDSDGAVWDGDEKTKEIDYLISCPIIIEGDHLAGTGYVNQNLQGKDSLPCRSDDLDCSGRWREKELCNFSGCFG